jgi:Na+-driven multidrug efflux pump
MVTGNFFQSVGMAGKAIFLSMSRQVLFLIPLLLTLPAFYGADGVWWSMPISDALSSIVATFLLLNQIKKLKNYNSDGI